MSNLRAITFDFHNTLADCDEWFALEIRELAAAFLVWQAAEHGWAVDGATLDAARDAYRALRLEIIQHGREATAEACVATVLARLELESTPTEIETGVRTLMEHALAESSPSPGAVVTVRTIAAAGVPLGIVSSAVYHPFLEWSLAKFGILDAFTDITTSASAGFYKSRPELYWHSASQLGVAPEAIVHVGDSFRWDVAGAQAAGFETVWIRNKPDAAPDGMNEPRLVLASLEGAAPALLSLVGWNGGS